MNSTFNDQIVLLEIDQSDLVSWILSRNEDQQTYALDENGRAIGLGAGWYRARGTYSAFNTCNTWVAAGLSKAGCPISPALCLTPGQLLGRVRPFARDLSARR